VQGEETPFMDLYSEYPEELIPSILKEASKITKSYRKDFDKVIETYVNKNIKLKLVTNAQEYSDIVSKSSETYPKLSKQEAIKKYIVGQGYDGIIDKIGKDYPEYAVYNEKMLTPNRLMAIAITSLLFSSAQEAKAAQPSDEDAVKAILGEVGPYGKEGMQWVASALRNRDNGVNGVYGGKNPNVVNKKYTQKQYEEAKQAWEESKNKDFTGGASNWFSDADLKQSKVQEIIKKDKLVFINRVGKNNFYRKSTPIKKRGK
jgi:hypothetical protein